MAATAVYKTWRGTQGVRLRFWAAEPDWKPPAVVTQLDAELPEAQGHVVMQLRAPRGGLEVMVFQLASCPSVFFCVTVQEAWDAAEWRDVAVYAHAAPALKEGFLSSALSGPVLERLKLKESLAELRAYVPTEGGLAAAKAELSKERETFLNEGSTCILV